MHGIGICLIIICIGFNLILSCIQSNPKMYLSLKHPTIKDVLADLLRDHTHTVRGCFHLGVCVLLHLSVFFDCPSTATSTYGLGPNQFLLFSLSFAERTTRKNIPQSNYSFHIFWSSFIASDIFENIYLWLAIGPSWLIHNSAGFVATPVEPA